MDTDFYNKIAKSNASTNCRNNLKKMVLNDFYLPFDLISITICISDKKPLQSRLDKRNDSRNGYNSLSALFGSFN